ncbi:hypothetical protein [Aquabacterium sp.]|uniref:hypothetical protein n=1 Tax=Aquabacterium sp. TaxID=1872578 RepID=UPI002C858B3E|nr:hypothetical protein [Aquabacterium sp.]HSW07232.1 hypothetical protein [Aquabacterium sp.]
MKRWFHRVVLSRLWLTFIVMTLSFFAFGIGTLNLFYLLRANSSLLLDHGWQALMDGGAAQLVELLTNGLLGMAAYLVFKACEYRLVHWLGDPRDSH